MSKKVLVVDDDIKTVEVVSLYLKHDGYRVLAAHEGNEALRLARESNPDLIVLDIMLPGRDGMDICRALRAESDVPIIMLTARTEEEDKLKGLDLGADDYIVKPFSTRELAARIRAVLRRLPDAYLRGPQEITRGQLKVNFVNHKVSLAGKALHLTPTEFKLLGALIKEPNRVFSRAQLVEKAFGYDYEGFDRSIDFHILNLRRKLNPDPNHSMYINNIYGTGYTFYAGAK
ncbi:XRE family transcriptional regulator [Dehalococcoides mccartyi CG4]|uniref:response regulator transcription factor n=1 Tax=Dehalococcoides mccartyi TaxID=61435 RepID=UPI0004E0964C|nr:response regulator transcription factor [Dehalococcoides mccartyi]AII59483.1 XRE family transcriptional regulator [Dehalococcoides mccartyi CG4]